MSGLNETGRIQAAGIAAKKGSVTRVPLRDIFVPTKGVTAHPRWELPLDEELIAYIMANGVPDKITLRENGIKDDVLILELCNGARRTKNGLEAERRLRETAPRLAPLSKDPNDPDGPGILYADVELFKGSDAEFLLQRLRTNSDKFQKPDSAGVLAKTVKQLAKAGCADLDAIVAVMPRGVGKKEVQALERYDNLTGEARALFDSGEAPIGILSAVLDSPREDQFTVAQRLIAAGVTNGMTATKVINRERAKAAAEKSEAPVRRNIPKPVVIGLAKDLAVAPAERKATAAKLDVLGGEAPDVADALRAEGWVQALKWFTGEKTGTIPKSVAKAIQARLGAK